jgi:hypothetical protein
VRQDRVERHERAKYASPAASQAAEKTVNALATIDGEDPFGPRIDH